MKKKKKRDDTINKKIKKKNIISKKFVIYVETKLSTDDKNNKYHKVKDQ